MVLRSGKLRLELGNQRVLLSDLLIQVCDLAGEIGVLSLCIAQLARQAIDLRLLQRHVCLQFGNEVGGDVRYGLELVDDIPDVGDHIKRDYIRN